MIRALRNNSPVYLFTLLEKMGGALSHAVLTRHTEITDEAAIQKIFGTDSSLRSFKKQLHGIDAWVYKNNSENVGMGMPEEGDILITDRPQVPLLISTADCASVILFDERKKVIANIHAGWRGAAGRIVRAAVNILKQRFGSTAADLFAFIGPSIGPCCFRFTEPKKELPKFMHNFIGEQNSVNLWGALETQLKECAIPADRIENARLCTSCNIEDFFSYRREGGKTGRFATIIMLK